jgi:hypothetical protein
MVLNREKQTISSKVQEETRMSALSIFIQYSSWTPSQSNKARERNKRNTNRKEVKLSLFSYDMILYIKYSKATHQRINIQNIEKTKKIKHQKNK